MANIKDAIQEIVDELKNLRDLRNVPDAPPESNDRFPFVIVYPASGEFRVCRCVSPQNTRVAKC